MKLAHVLSLASLCTLAANSFSAATAVAADRNVVSHSFVEDNDLWKQDGMFEKENMTQEEFDIIIDNAYAVYAPLAEAKGEHLEIAHLWNDSTVNANCSNMGGTIHVNMYGGLARRPEITRDGFALVLCHELGHAFAGAPYANPVFQLSAEGMADYYGAGTCLTKVLPTLAQDSAPTETDYIRARCTEKHGSDTNGYQACLRQFSAGQALGNLLSVVKKQPVPNFETPDPTVVPKTLGSYPATVQCRLDTYRAGALEQPRPACWFKN